MSAGKMLHTRNVLSTDFKKLGGTVIATRMNSRFKIADDINTNQIIIILVDIVNGLLKLIDITLIILLLTHTHTLPFKL